MHFETQWKQICVVYLVLIIYEIVSTLDIEDLELMRNKLTQRYILRIRKYIYKQTKVKVLTVLKYSILHA